MTYWMSADDCYRRHRRRHRADLAQEREATMTNQERILEWAAGAADYAAMRGIVKELEHAAESRGRLAGIRECVAMLRKDADQYWRDAWIQIADEIRRSATKLEALAEQSAPMKGP